MNDVYGIDPAAPSDFRDFAHLMRLFDVDQGRFIADFPNGGWFPEVKQHLATLGALDQMKAMELWLRIGRSALVPVLGKFNPARSWPENIGNLQVKLAALVGARGCPATLTPIDQILFDPRGFPDASGEHVTRSAIAYANAARPLLQTSPKIVLIDPHFRLREYDEGARSFQSSIRFQKSLEALLREAMRWGRVEDCSGLIFPDNPISGNHHGNGKHDQEKAAANFRYELQAPSGSNDQRARPEHRSRLQRHAAWRNGGTALAHPV